jgi:hypothetical protein
MVMDARRAAQGITASISKLRNAADAPLRRNPEGRGWQAAWRRLSSLI